jgi:hypothetical protein
LTSSLSWTMCEVLLVGLVKVTTGSTTPTVLVTPSASPTCGEPRAQLRRGRRTLLHQEAGPGPITGGDGVTALAHHAVRRETVPRPSSGVLANTKELGRL